MFPSVARPSQAPSQALGDTVGATGLAGTILPPLEAVNRGAIGAGS